MGPGRPKLDKVTKTITLSPEVAEKLNAHAKPRRGQQSQLVERLLRKHLGMNASKKGLGIMSFSISVPVNDESTLGSVFKDALGELYEGASNEVVNEALMASQGALELYKTGVLGHKGVIANLSGHVNEDPESYGSYISINISTRRPSEE